MRKVKLILGTAVLVLIATGCASQRTYPTFAEDGSHGHFSMTADAQGMREFQTGLAGIIREGKAPAKAETTPYWEYRKHQEQGIVLQKIDPESQGFGSILKKFFTGAELTPTVPQEPQGS